jgi:hypothetical protein
MSTLVAPSVRSKQHRPVLENPHQRAETKQEMSMILHIIGTALKWEIIPASTNITEAKLSLQGTLKGLTQCRKEAKDLRQAYLDERIGATTNADKTTAEKILKKIIHREAQSTCFGKLAYALKPSGAKAGVTHINIKV